MTNTAERKLGDSDANKGNTREREYVWVMVQSKVTGKWRKHTKHNTYDDAVVEMMKLIVKYPTATFRILKTDGTHIY